MSEKLASGIFMWTGTERRSGRYGYLFMADANFDETAKAPVTFDDDLARGLQGHRVKLWAVVREARPSGHAGDRYLNIFPSTPAVGEEIELGVGIFHAAPSTAADLVGVTEFGLKPGDGRDELWLDPRILYRLHDQTVDIFAEETDDDFPPAPNLVVFADETRAISNGDGTMQLRTKGPLAKIKGLPRFENLGDGMFALHRPTAHGNPGEEIDIELG